MHNLKKVTVVITEVILEKIETEYEGRCIAYK